MRDEEKGHRTGDDPERRGSPTEAARGAARAAGASAGAEEYAERPAAAGRLDTAEGAEPRFEAARDGPAPEPAATGSLRRLALWVLLPYAAFVAIWILLVGPALGRGTGDPLGRWEPWIFLVLGLSLLYVLFRSEARGRSSTEKTLSATLSAVPDAVAILRREDGALVEANDGFRQFGYRRSELLGRSLEEAGVWRPGETHRLQERLRGGDPVHDLESAFLTKDGTPRTVIVSARSVDGRTGQTVLVAHDVTAERESQARSAWQVLHDPLTGLPNHELLLDRLVQALLRARRREMRVAVLTLNVDRFRVVNESLGHAAGDRLLQGIADRLVTSLRAEDTVARSSGTRVGPPGTTVARLGGDEFTVVLEGIAAAEDARAVLERIQGVVSEPFSVDAEEVTITASVGVAVSPGGGDAEPGELLRHAAIALRRAKEKGLGREHLFDAAVDSRAVRRLRLEGDLRGALDRGEVELHYQPIVSLAGGGIVGVESLMRWKHEELGYVSPLEIIPIAEESGLIIELGRWVLGEACRQAAEWSARRPELGPLTVAVNVSAREIQEPAFRDLVADALRESGLPAERLVLEITEGLMMQSLLGLRRLKGLDVRVAIDDFGTGYSALAYLSRLPVDAIKIDRSFVEELGRDDDSTAVGRAMVAMADSLGLDTIAEGIEAEEQLAAVRELGCTYGQGYLFSRPQPPDRLEALLTERPRW